MTKKIRFLWGWQGNSPDNYTKNLNHENNAQISHHIYYGLRQRFENVVWGLDNYNEDDIVITTFGLGDFQVNTSKMRNLIMVGNHCMYNGVWSVNNPWGGYCEFHTKEMIQAKFVILKTNSVSLYKYENSDPSIMDFKNFITKNHVNLILLPHPIDKKRFNREIFTPKNRNFLVLGGSSDNKRQHIFRSICNQYVVFTNAKWFIPKTYQQLIKKCSFVAHISKYEGFPYFGNESLCKGLLLFGGENWWDGYGHEELIWRENDEKGNKDKIKNILSGGVDSIYESVISKHLNRTDNNWDYFVDILSDCIRKVDTA